MARTKALGYVRVSTVEQTKGFGLEVQRQAIREHCRANGLQLVAIHADEGISGSNGLDTREGLAEALVAIERQEAAVLVVYRLDRLARDLLLQETTIARLRTAGAGVVSVSEPDVDSEDPTRVLVRQVLGAIGQYERALIRGRMLAGKAAKVAAGGYGGGRPPYGYRAVAGELVEDEREQAVICRARALTEQGRSLRQVAAQLDQDGLRPRGAGRWHPQTVAALLRA